MPGTLSPETSPAERLNTYPEQEELEAKPKDENTMDHKVLVDTINEWRIQLRMVGNGSQNEADAARLRLIGLEHADASKISPEVAEIIYNYTETIENIKPEINISDEEAKDLETIGASIIKKEQELVSQKNASKPPEMIEAERELRLRAQNRDISLEQAGIEFEEIKTRFADSVANPNLNRSDIQVLGYMNHNLLPLIAKYQLEHRS